MKVRLCECEIMKENQLDNELQAYIDQIIEDAAERAAAEAIEKFDREMYEDAIKKSKRLSKQKERKNK